MLFSIYIGLVTEESKAYWENQLKYFAFKTFAEVRYVNIYIHTYIYVNVCMYCIYSSLKRSVYVLHILRLGIVSYNVLFNTANVSP